MLKQQSMQPFLIPPLVGLILAGCAASTMRGGLPPIPEADLALCVAATPLKSGSHQELERWAKARGFDYRDCADRHKELSEKIRLRQRLEQLGE